MRRVVPGLCVVGLMLALVGSAQAGWVWRGGRWQYVEGGSPPPPPDQPPREVPAPKEPPPLPPPPAAPGETPRAEPPSAAEKAEPSSPWWRFGRPADPNPDRTLFEEGRRAYEARDYGSAARTLKGLIKKHPASPHREEAMWLRAEALLARKDHYAAFHQYEDLLTNYAGSPHYRAALQREIEIAEVFFGPTRRKVLGIPLTSGDTEAVEILRKAYEHQPAGDLADDIVLRIADHHWSKGRWPEAEEYYDKYCREYPNGPDVERAELQRAKCAIEKCCGPQYDTTALRLAYDRLRQFQAKFPDAAAREGVADLMAAVRDRQAESLYGIAWRYRRGHEPLAAAFYAERLRERFPDTRWSERAREFLADTSPDRQRPPPVPEEPKP